MFVVLLVSICAFSHCFTGGCCVVSAGFLLLACLSVSSTSFPPVVSVARCPLLPPVLSLMVTLPSPL